MGIVIGPSIAGERWSRSATNWFNMCRHDSTSSFSPLLFQPEDVFYCKAAIITIGPFQNGKREENYLGVFSSRRALELVHASPLQVTKISSRWHLRAFFQCRKALICEDRWSDSQGWLRCESHNPQNVATISLSLLLFEVSTRSLEVKQWYAYYLEETWVHYTGSVCFYHWVCLATRRTHPQPCCCSRWIPDHLKSYSDAYQLEEIKWNLG